MMLSLARKTKNLLHGACALALLGACASGREFWTYVVEAPVEKPTSNRESGTVIGDVKSPNIVRVVYSDGSTSTEVQIPVLATGEQIVIDQKGRPSAEALHLVPLAPAPADQGLEQNYVATGKAIGKDAAPVSIVKTNAMVKKLVKEGNYSLALEYVDQLLHRYPQHVESLRAKGSILLKMGEREGALDAYRKAQEIEPSRQVEKQINDLERALGDR